MSEFHFVPVQLDPWLCKADDTLQCTMRHCFNTLKFLCARLCYSNQAVFSTNNLRSQSDLVHILCLVNCDHWMLKHIMIFFWQAFAFFHYQNGLCKSLEFIGVEPNKVSRRFTGLDLSSTLVYDYPTLSGIAEMILNQIPEESSNTSEQLALSRQLPAQIAESTEGRHQGHSLSILANLQLPKIKRVSLQAAMFKKSIILTL